MTDEDKKPEPTQVQEAVDERDEEEEVMDPEKEARMLLNPPADSVQFTGGSNGAQVTLPAGVKSGVGMTKAELMKYANDPFWVRLRMFLFIMFWVIWFAMLFGAVAIIAFAPGCPATAKLPWWKKCSFMQVSVRDDAPNFNDKMSQALNDIASLKSSLPTLKNTAFDGIIVSGVNPFFLASDTDNNATNDAAVNFRKKFVEFVQAVHSDEFNNGKLIMSMHLSETSTSSPWYLKSADNETGYQKLYIWRDEVLKGPAGMSWEYNSDRFNYGLRRAPGYASLNFAAEATLDKMNKLVIDWGRTRVDGMQADGDFYVDDGDVHVSEDVLATFRKWIKAGGENKAFLVANSKFAEKSSKSGEEPVFNYELSPETTLWDDLVKSNDHKKKLDDIYKGIMANEVDLGISNKTAKDYAQLKAHHVGDKWKTYKIQHSESEKNSLALTDGKKVAEGVIAAFFMMPKVTPIVEIQMDQISKLATDTFLPGLHKLRKTHSEAFLLGETKMPTVSAPEVFAVQRVFSEKNNVMLLINFSGVSQDIKLSGNSFPDMTTHEAKIILVDSQSPQSLIGTTVTFPSFKIDAKQVLVLEIVPKN